MPTIEGFGKRCNGEALVFSTRLWRQTAPILFCATPEPIPADNILIPAVLDKNLEGVPILSALSPVEKIIITVPSGMEERVAARLLHHFSSLPNGETLAGELGYKRVSSVEDMEGKVFFSSSDTLRELTERMGGADFDKYGRRAQMVARFATGLLPYLYKLQIQDNILVHWENIRMTCIRWLGSKKLLCVQKT